MPSTPRSSTCRRGGWSTCWPGPCCGTTRSTGWGGSGVPAERVLAAGDLWCRFVTDGSCCAPAASGAGSLPRLTSAHNYNRRSPGVYRFLAAVQADGVAETVGWTWFPFDHAPFTPRVRWGPLVLARARWRPRAMSCGRSTSGSRWRDGPRSSGGGKRRRLPRWVCLVEGDNVLPFDLDNVVSVDAFVRTVRHRDEALLEELFPGPDELVAEGPGGHHAVEVVVPLVQDRAPAPAAPASPPADAGAGAGAAGVPARLGVDLPEALRRLGDRRPPAPRDGRPLSPAGCWAPAPPTAGSSSATTTPASTCGSASTATPAPSGPSSTRSSPGSSTTAWSTTRSTAPTGGRSSATAAPRGSTSPRRCSMPIRRRSSTCSTCSSPGAAGLDARWRIGAPRHRAPAAGPGPRRADARRALPAHARRLRATSSGPTPRSARASAPGSAASSRPWRSSWPRPPPATTHWRPASRSSTSGPPASRPLARELRARRLTDAGGGSGRRLRPHVAQPPPPVGEPPSRVRDLCPARPPARGAGPPAMTRDEVLSRTVFTVDGEAYTWADVVAAAQAWGEWARGARRAHRATSVGWRSGRRPSAATAACSPRTRPRRGSSAGASRCPTGWRTSATGPRRTRTRPPGSRRSSSGTFERIAHRLAGGLAAYRALGGAGRPDPAALDAAVEDFAARAASPDRVAAVIAANRLAWTALDLRHAGRRRRRPRRRRPPDDPRRRRRRAGPPARGGGRRRRRRPGDRRRRAADVRRASPNRAHRGRPRRRRPRPRRGRRHRPPAGGRIPGALDRAGGRTPAGTGACGSRADGRRRRRSSSGPARRIRRFPTVLGVDEMDCGAACLAAVCRHFGRAVSLPTVRDAVATAVDGTSLAGLVSGAERLGLAARALKASPSRLDALPLPAICHWQGNHWVVLHDTDERSVRVMDPVAGPRRIPRTEWDENWSGFSCLVAPTPALAAVPEGQPPWRWLLPFFRPHRRPFATAVALGLGAAGLEMLIPLAAGRIVDGAIAEGDRGQLHLLALGMLGVLVAAVTAGLVQRWLLARVAVRFDAATLDHITERLLALPATYFGVPPHRRHRTAGRRHAPGPHLPGPAGRGRPHRRRPGRGGRRDHGRSSARRSGCDVPGHRAPLRGGHGLLPPPAPARSWPRSRRRSAATTPARSMPSAASTRSRPGARNTPSRR